MSAPNTTRSHNYADWLADTLAKSREHTTVPTRLSAHQIRTLHAILRTWNADRQARGLRIVTGTEALDKILAAVAADIGVT